MARRRFFVPEIRNQHAELTGDDARHLTQVLRVETGHRYELSDNQQVYLAEVELARKERIVFRTLERLPDEQPLGRITLLAALIKFDKFEWIIEKATELGVERIVAVETARSEHGLERAAPKRLPRWQRIALESSQQARRCKLPEVEGPIRYAEALQSSSPYRIFLDEARRGESIAHHLAGIRPVDAVSLLVGPEGGWTDEEREGALAAGWRRASLGPLILRAETAALAALAVVNAALQG